MLNSLSTCPYCSFHFTCIAICLSSICSNVCVCAAENLYAIETLKDFSYNEDGRDIGLNVREKSKALVALLRDDDKLRNERVKASKARACALARPSDAAAAHVRLHYLLGSSYCQMTFASSLPNWPRLCYMSNVAKD